MLFSYMSFQCFNVLVMPIALWTFQCFISIFLSKDILPVTLRKVPMNFVEFQAECDANWYH